jgi:hypothetical protein
MLAEQDGYGAELHIVNAVAEGGIPGRGEPD